MPEVLKVKGSETLSLVKKIVEQQKSGKDIIRLDIGEPDFRTPETIKTAAKKALDNNDTHYFSQGSDELKERVLKSLEEEGLHYGTNEILITPGSKQAIFYSLFLIARRRETVVLDPSYPAYPDVVEIVGGKTVRVDCGRNFVPDIEAIRKSMTPKTSLLVINSPNNPTGIIYRRKTLEEIAELAIEKDLYVLTDEIYKKIVYGDERHVSIASLNGMKERCIVSFGFSKTYAMTGWRLGFACAPEEIVSQMKNLQQQTVIAPTAFVQTAGLKALNGTIDRNVKKMVDEYRKRKDAFCRTLKGADGIELVEPEGAFYCLPDFRDATNLRGLELFQSLLRSGVSSVPGSFFGPSYSSHLRFSFSQLVEKVKEGAERTRAFCEEQQSRVSLASR